MLAGGGRELSGRGRADVHPTSAQSVTTAKASVFPDVMAYAHAITRGGTDLGRQCRRRLCQRSLRSHARAISTRRDSNVALVPSRRRMT